MSSFAGAPPQKQRRTGVDGEAETAGLKEMIRCVLTCDTTEPVRLKAVVEWTPGWRSVNRRENDSHA